MKNKIYVLLVFFSFIFSAGSAQSDQVKDILAASNAGYSNYLQQIPVGQESFFGFKDRNEFAIAKIGKPYQVFTLTQEFFSDSILSDKDYMTPINEWRVAITVNGENRLLLTVAKMNGVWQAVGIGSVGLAVELGQNEAKNSSPNQQGIILRVYKPYYEFFLTSLEKQSRAFPLQSAKMALNNINDSSSYSLAETLTMIKNKSENK